MAYVAPTIRSAGDAVTAADYNIMANDVIDHETRIGDSGLVLVTPTSVSGTGMSVSGGQISLSAVTTGTMNGLFTSTYSTYNVVFSLDGSTTNQYCYVQFATGGTAATTNYIGGFRSWDYSSGATTFNSTGTESSRIAIGNPESGGAGMIATVTIDNPAVARYSNWVGQSSGTASGTSRASWILGGQHGTATSYDGLVITQSAGNVTGTIRVYGHTKS